MTAVADDNERKDRSGKKTEGEEEEEKVAKEAFIDVPHTHLRPIHTADILRVKAALRTRTATHGAFSHCVICHHSHHQSLFFPRHERVDHEMVN